MMCLVKKMREKKKETFPKKGLGVASWSCMMYARCGARGYKALYNRTTF
jgi:hypothetical protein